MWKDHKLLGVGLANWRKEYTTHYVDKEEVRKAAHQYYIYLKQKKCGKYSAKEDAAWQKAALRAELGFRLPHNVTVWFFSTTGILGGVGYLFFFAELYAFVTEKGQRIS